MEDVSKPLEYPEWREGIGRADDAAHTFGYHLMQYSRDEAVKQLPADLTEEQREKAVAAIHTALHNVMDLFEGYWPLPSGDKHDVEYVLRVVVKDKEQNEIEHVDLSPCKMDLPIGFWLWAEDNNFRGMGF